MVGIVGFGQNSNKINNNPKTIFDNSITIFDNSIDKYGNKYKNTDIIVGQEKLKNNSLTTNILLCSSGIFNLYFETGSGMESPTDINEIKRRNVLCQVFSDISNFVVSPLQNSNATNKVNILIIAILASINHKFNKHFIACTRFIIISRKNQYYHYSPFYFYLMDCSMRNPPIIYYVQFRIVQ